MPRNFKHPVPILILLLIGAWTVLGAPNAQAAEFHCGAEPCRIRLSQDGSQELRVDGEGSSVAFLCSKLSGEGTLEGGSSETLTITNIEYKNCLNAGVPAPVNMNGCDYLIGASGSLSIKCPAGKPIEWHPFGCTSTYWEQEAVAEIKYHTIEENEALTVEFKGAKMTGFTHHVGECPLKSGVSTGRVVRGNTIFLAETDDAKAEPVTMWWE